MNPPPRSTALAARAVLSPRIVASPTEPWRPQIFDPGEPSELEALEALLRSGSLIAVHDTLEAQLGDLIETRRPSETLSSDQVRAAVHEHLGGRDPDRYGVWVHFPWSRRVAHVLPPDEFYELRTNRNQNKISKEEQALLRRRTIAVVGLSVGQTSAVTLAMEGVGGRFVLADFDWLALSNMNRLRGTVCDLGINKCVLAARQMFELDPFLEIELFQDGATASNVDAILGGTRTVDLLVEECDSLDVKVLLRQHARRRGIPVVMETSDRGLIDIERFDREPERPLFHGLIGEIDTSSLAGLSTKDKLPFVLRILGETAISDRLAGSMFSVGDTLKTWPQLASAVTHGGAAVTDVARRILLGELEESGRYYVDLEQLIRDGAAVAVSAPQAPYVHGEPLVETSLHRLGRGRALGPSPEELRAIVEHGVMAPSAGNAQPWRFHFDGERLRCSLEPEEGWTFLDFERGATYLAFGAACENMELAAAALGLRADVHPFPEPDDPSLVFTLRFARDPQVEASPLLAAIPLRATNRQRGEPRPLAQDDRHALEHAAERLGATLRVVDRPDRLEAIAQLLGRVDRMAFLNRRMHQEIMSEFRWTTDDAHRSRDGIDIATLDLSRADAAVFRMLAHWPGMAFLKRMGGSSSLEKPSRDAVRASSAVAVLTVPGTSPLHYFEGGRAMQRVWLTATTRNVWLQPMAMLPYLLARFERGGAAQFEDRDARAMQGHRDAFREIFPGTAGNADVMLFRIFLGPAPSTRALRRPLSELARLE